MILYHGSNVEVRNPDLAYSKPYKDFGRGGIFRLICNRHNVWPNSARKC